MVTNPSQTDLPTPPGSTRRFGVSRNVIERIAGRAALPPTVEKMAGNTNRAVPTPEALGRAARFLTPRTPDRPSAYRNANEKVPS